MPLPLTRPRFAGEGELGEALSNGRMPAGPALLFAGECWRPCEPIRKVCTMATLPGPSMNDSRHSNRTRRSHLVLGVFLFTIGGILLAANLGYGIPWDILLYWPIVLMAFGLVGLAMPSRHMRRSGGLWLFVSGLYCQIGLTHWFGLGWWSAWPVFVIAAGVDLIFFKHEDKRDEATRGI